MYSIWSGVEHSTVLYLEDARETDFGFRITDRELMAGSDNYLLLL